MGTAGSESRIPCGNDSRCDVRGLAAVRCCAASRGRHAKIVCNAKVYVSDHQSDRHSLGIANLF